MEDARDDGTAGSWDARFLSGKGGYSSAPHACGGSTSNETVPSRVTPHRRLDKGRITYMCRQRTFHLESGNGPCLPRFTHTEVNYVSHVFHLDCDYRHRCGCAWHLRL